MVSDSLQYYSEVVCMIVSITEVDKNIINEDYNQHVQVLLEHSVHQVHEGCWGICETKESD